MTPREYEVILAEDNEKLRRKFVDLLAKEGFRVIEASDGKELYEKAINYKASLDKLVILSDTDMPELCGDEACKKLLEEERFRKVIMIGMSDNSRNEEYWKNIGLWQTFIFKGVFINIENFQGNLASLLINRINTINNNPSFYLLDNKDYRRGI